MRDDFESGEFFVEILRRSRISLFILDPDAERLAELLSQVISSAQASGIAVRWEQLAKAILSKACSNGL